MLAHANDNHVDHDVATQRSARVRSEAGKATRRQRRVRSTLIATAIAALVSVADGIGEAASASPLATSNSSVSAKSTISASLVRVSVSVGGRKRSASGVVIRADGYILTSAAFAAGHGPKLADTDTPFEITTSTGSPATARLIGVDPGTGLAVLRAVGQFEPATFVATGEAAGSLVADTARLGMVLINSRGQIVALYPSPSSPHPVPADAVLRAAVGMIAAATMH